MLGCQITSHHRLKPVRAYIPVALLVTVILLIVFTMEGLYARRRGTTWLDEIYTIFTGTLVSMAIMIFVFFLYRAHFYSRLIFFYAVLLIVGLWAWWA